MLHTASLHQRFKFESGLQSERQSRDCISSTARNDGCENRPRGYRGMHLDFCLNTPLIDQNSITGHSSACFSSLFLDNPDSPPEKPQSTLVVDVPVVRALSEHSSAGNNILAPVTVRMHLVLRRCFCFKFDALGMLLSVAGPTNSFSFFIPTSFSLPFAPLSITITFHNAIFTATICHFLPHHLRSQCTYRSGTCNFVYYISLN